VVCAELDFIAFLRCRVRGRHNSRIVNQYIETGLGRQECGGRGRDRREGRQIQREVDYFARRGYGGADVGDGGCGFGGGARGEVDACGRVRGEVGYCLLA
jgi:hypothetical protein